MLRWTGEEVTTCRGRYAEKLLPPQPTPQKAPCGTKASQVRLPARRTEGLPYEGAQEREFFKNDRTTRECL